MKTKFHENKKGGEKVLPIPSFPSWHSCASARKLSQAETGPFPPSCCNTIHGKAYGTEGGFPSAAPNPGQKQEWNNAQYWIKEALLPSRCGRSIPWNSSQAQTIPLFTATRRHGFYYSFSNPEQQGKNDFLPPGRGRNSVHGTRDFSASRNFPFPEPESTRQDLQVLFP